LQIELIVKLRQSLKKFLQETYFHQMNRIKAPLDFA